ncbi:MAG: methionine--tRNA ligase [Bacillota bacterium]|nr:methionine--tRNA ligase [Bacillota bacterium]
MAGKETYYITTPIYYPSNKLHVGNSYTTVAADAMARYKRLTGYDVWFLTGTDEHGQKIQRQAEAAGKTPRAFVDEIVAWIKDLWQELDINYDDFIRTTEERHKEKVARIFTRFYEQGDIYKGKYEGWYCTPCEAYWTERQLIDGKCPDCGREAELIAEEAYFFRMSRYADRLLNYIESHPNFIQPPSRKNEMINNFLKPGLEDLCVSRTSFNWGIPVPFDPDHIIYVWLDALSNYITALGYGEEGSIFDKYWPADVQLIGKDILRFHTIYWPIFLMALDLPLPKTVFGHGWLMLQEGKMSKSKGNAVDPMMLVNRYNSDALRYFLLREIPFGQDGVFSLESFLTRINTDLANDLGNLVSRTLTMAERYFGGVLPQPGQDPEKSDMELQNIALGTPGIIDSLMNELRISDSLAELWKLVRRSNKYIDENTPWELARDPARKERLGTVIYNLIESIRFIAVMLRPYMPRTPERIWEQIGLRDNKSLQNWESLQNWGGIEPNTVVARGEDLFPRLNLQAEIREVQGITPVSEHPASNTAEENEGLINLEQFQLVDLRVADILSAEKIAKSDKLLKVELDTGNDERRQVVAGIAEHYRPEELIGKRVLFVANLKPVKLRGVLSQGMLLAATGEDGKLALTTVDRDISPGSRIS